MTLDDFIKNIAIENDITQKEAKKITNSIFVKIKNIMSNEDSILIPNFARFCTKIKKARLGTNLNTNEKVEIPAKIGISFNPTKSLKESVETNI